MKLDLYFTHWEEVRRGLLETIDGFSDSELAYMPFPGSWSVGAIMLHIAETEAGWLGYLVERRLAEWPEYPLNAYPHRDTIKELLTDIHSHTWQLLAGLDIADLERQIPTSWDSRLSLNWILWHVLEHEIHHRGELSLILGTLGRPGLDV